MTAREQLNSWIDGLERRLRLGALCRGAAVIIFAGLATTVVLVLIINKFAFSKGSVIGARGVLIVVLAFAVEFALAIPLWRLNRRRAAITAEAEFPQLQQRLITFAERGQGEAEPFLELLAADTLAETRKAQVDGASLVSDTLLLASTGIGVASLGVLIWLVFAGGAGFLGYGASLLWTGTHRGVAPLYDIRVSPGDATVRRNADELVTAQPIGIQADNVRLYARYQSSSNWQQLDMRRASGSSGFQFTFAGLPEGVEYYVEAGHLRSRHFNIRVADVPSIRQMRVTYHYPAWTGMPISVDQHGGDLRALEGTQADVEIMTDRPLRDGILVLDDQQQIQLSDEGQNSYKGTIQIDKDGAYHVAALDQGQPVRLSEDFFIAAAKANPPQVVIARPAGDYEASPIEEVTVAVKADDEFGLKDVQLHYSVNGGIEQSINMLTQKGQKSADGSTVLHLEDFKVVPGDIVTVYATAKDAKTDSQTDMFFIQAAPFEREYSQSQQSGGAGGGAGGAQSEISEREKQIIEATWKQLGDRSITRDKSAENAKFLSGVQTTLRQQSLSLSSRLDMRDLSQQNQEFSDFQRDMKAAADAMDPASQKLQDQKWNDAIPSEQKALQYLLRAEATFRQIQIAFGTGGGGAGGSAGRDLASLFDLELDTQKNQYESAQTAGSSGQSGQQADDALQKLEELARRQQELADEQKNNSAQSFEQRWQQEMLRREAEELQRQIEQLSSKNGQPAGESQDGQGSSGSSAQSGSRNGSQSSSDSRAQQQALDQLRQAGEDMGRAASQQQSEENAHSAADRLRQAQSLLSGMQHKANAGKLDSLANEADQLARQQKAQNERIHQTFGNSDSAAAAGKPQIQTPNRGQEAQTLADDRQHLADDLASLEKEMRDAEGGLASTNQAAASRLRQSLSQLDDSDLETQMQRSADRLRRGLNPDTNSSESQIALGLQNLSDQIRQAQKALGDGQSQGPDNQNALDQIERFRNRLEALNRGASGPNSPGQGQSNQAARQGGTGQQGSAQSPGTAPGQGIIGRNPGGSAGGADRQYGYGGMDTGNNSTTGAKVMGPTDQSNAAADPEKTFQQGLDDLDQLQQTVRGDPEAMSKVEDLIHEMQALAPGRFPGNPALVEQLHAQVMSDVDKLELQLQRQADAKQSGQVRTQDALPVPPDYKDAVAEYFRRLSNHQ